MSINSVIVFLSDFPWPTNPYWTVVGTIIGSLSLIAGVVSLVMTFKINVKQKNTEKKIGELVEARIKEDSYEMRRSIIGVNIEKVLNEDKRGNDICSNDEVNRICADIGQLLSSNSELSTRFSGVEEVKSIMRKDPDLVLETEKKKLKQILSEWASSLSKCYNELKLCEPGISKEIREALADENKR